MKRHRTLNSVPFAYDEGVSMIRVIASDMDGTLLNEEHMLSERTITAIKAAQKKGIRFIISTGRSFKQVMHVMKNVGITCDYIVNSGAEIRNADNEILQSSCMNMRDCKATYEVLKKYNVTCLFTTDEMDYYIGSLKEREQELIEHIRLFQPNLSEAEIRDSELFLFLTMNTIGVSSFDELEALNPRIIKVFAMSNDLGVLKKIDAELQKNPNLAVASSFANNIEVTDKNAQKGIALKNYIESLGYTMDEVMVFGDSMNDYSMLSMNFGVTIAMENGMKKIKDAAKYVTKSNAEDGVAYVIEELLSKYLEL